MSLWVLAAIGAITYITMLATGSLPQQLHNTMKPAEQPLLARDIAGTALKTRESETLLREIKSTLNRTNNSLKQLNVKYFALENRITTVERQNIQEQQTRQKQDDDNPLTGALSAADRKITPPNSTGAITRKTPPALQETPKADDNPAEIPAPIAKPKPLEKSIEKKVAAAIIEKPIIKNPVAAKPEKQQGPVIMRTMFAVSLGNFPDLTQLKKAWASLSKKHQNALGTLKPRYLTLVVENQPQYQLITGPLANALEAAKICYYLQQMKTYCRQTVFHGTDI